MFFTFAEKRRGGLSAKWRVRQIAFDTKRRHLYVSDEVSDPNELAPPQGFPEPRETSDVKRAPSLEAVRSASPTRSRNNTPAPASAVSSGRRGASVASGLSSAVYDSNVVETPLAVSMTKVWKRKLKVDLIEIVAKEQLIMREEGRNGEKNFFEVTLFGETRKLEKGEGPEAEPLLCPSSGLGGLAGRFSSRNLAFVKDPFFFCELHQGLTDQFNTLRIERDTERERRHLTGSMTAEELAAGQRSLDGRPLSVAELAREMNRLTLPSPRVGKKSLHEHFTYRTEVSLRFRNDYEFRRFWYVVQTVLGYDQLCARPYRGLPPYDPRNGIVFAEIPMAEFHIFRPIEKAILYTFLRGDLIGRTTKGELTVFQRSAHLCITHDLVIVLRDSCTVCRWCRLQDINTFEYNRHCARPYVAFLTDPGPSDIVFIPRGPAYGEEAIERFNPELETLRVLEVMRAAFYASLDIRRAIDIREAPENAVRSFVERVERDASRSLNFDPPVLYLGSESECDLPRERPADAWRAVQVLYSHQDVNRINRTAVPLYEGHPNSGVFEPEVLHEMEHHMEHERMSQYDVIGMSERAQAELRAAIAEGRYDLSTSSSRRESEASDEVDADHPYGIPGSHYLTTEEAAKSHECKGSTKT